MALKFCVIVFFDRARTEFIIHGPFDTYDDARRDADDTLRMYAPRVVDCVDVATIIEPKRVKRVK